MVLLLGRKIINAPKQIMTSDLASRLEQESGVKKEDRESAAKLGRLFGIEMTETMSSALSVFFALGVPKLRHWGQSKAQALSFQFFGNGEKTDLIRNALGYGIVLIPSILNFASSFKKVSEDFGDFGKQSDSVMSLHGDSTPGLINLLTHSWKRNTVFAPKRQMVLEQLKSNLGGDLMKLTTALPQIIAMRKEDALREKYPQQYKNTEDAWNKDPNRKRTALKDYQFREVPVLLDEADRKLFHKALGDMEWIDKWGASGATFLTDLIANNVGGDPKATSKQICSLDLIIRLQDEWRQSPDAKSVGTTRASLTSLIETIFDQHQKENGFKALPERRKAEVAGLMASAIQFGSMDPGSLAYLIGEGCIFRNAFKGDLKEDTKIEIAIDKETKRYNKVQVLDLETYLEDGHFDLKDIGRIFEAAKDRPDEMALLASVFPPEVVMKATGMAKKDVWNLMKSAGRGYYSEVTKTVAALAAKPDKELEAQGLNDDDIEALRRSAAVIKESGQRGVDEALQDKEKGATLKTVLAILLTKQKLETLDVAEDGNRKEPIDYTNAYTDQPVKPQRPIHGQHTARVAGMSQRTLRIS